MADVIVADHRHNDSISALESNGLRMTAPRIEMVPNPVFSFPMKAIPAAPFESASETQRRPLSMLLPPGPVNTVPHKRTASALPSFSFNSNDTSGRSDETPPRTPDENMSSLVTPVRKGHRRGGSEFVGGDSRFGVTNAITSSPTKSDAPLLPTAGRRGAHAHRRSVAVSSHDLSQIMSIGDRSPRLSTSLPTSPLDFPALGLPPPLPSQFATGDQLATDSQADQSPVRPPSRPRVDFVDQVEIIPRPLSTISSETESSVSTIMGHSVSGSINSVLSSNSPARPGSAHNRGVSVGHASIGSIAEPRPVSRPRSSIEISKRIEKEGEWLKSRAVDSSEPHHHLTLSTSEPIPLSQISIEEPTTVTRRQKRQSLGHAFGFDRRRSEPLISISASSAEPSRLSALSLQDVIARESLQPSTSHEKLTSGQKLKQWALSKLQRRHRDHRGSSGTANPLETRAGVIDSASAPEQVFDGHQDDNAVAETDLDAVFGADQPELFPPAAPRFGSSPTRITFEKPAAVSHTDADDGHMVDLDAALGPLRTPNASGNHFRRQMHSDRSVSGFVHRRAESEPVLMAFNYNRAAASSQKSMEDVFEEDEEESISSPTEEAGMGISMVDADRSAFDPSNPESLRLRRAVRDSDRPFTSYTTPTSMHLAIVPTVARPASLVNDIIAEESSPVEAIEIVEAHEEPRAASLEKSSDSSEVSTLLAAPMLALANEHGDTMLPESFDASELPSPDFTRRQGSFEASRVGTSASSLADTRTTSSCTTGEPHEVRMSVDDVPSLTSSRSTMISTSHADHARRDGLEAHLYEPVPRRLLGSEDAVARRKKRASIQSLSQLVGGTFGTSRSKHNDESRPQTATMALQAGDQKAKKKEHRLKKLMFWRSKQNLRQAAEEDAA